MSRPCSSLPRISGALSPIVIIVSVLFNDAKIPQKIENTKLLTSFLTEHHCCESKNRPVILQHVSHLSLWHFIFLPTSAILHFLSCRNMWFSVNANASSVSSRFDGFSSHSHTVIQCHPISANFCCSSLSRSLFLRIFATQNSRFVFGILQHSELSMTSSFLHLTSDITLCPCQKHPFTKIHVLYFLSTKSGCPGSRLWFNL